jgi:AcrR family transcriptional regulator
MLVLVAERGYAATTVPGVIAAARVSRNAFYAFFTDKADCFLALCMRDLDDVIETVNAAAASRADWIDALRFSVKAYLKWWQDRPLFTRAYFMELPLVGERASDQRERGSARFEQMFRAMGARARREQPGLPPLPEAVPRLLVLANTEYIASEVRAGRVAGLTGTQDDLIFLDVKMLSDDATAARAMERQRA